MLTPLVNVMLYILDFFFELTRSYGLSIILLTVVIKLILYPLTHIQTKSMAKMQELQPKMKEIQDKYKKDPQKMNQEIAMLYRDNKINPAMGCLPLLIQMPFLFALFQLLQNYNYGIEQARFLWLANLGAPDAYYILPILVGATTYLQQKVTPGASQGNKQQNMMLTMMPLLIMFMSLRFPSGLSLYWTVSNIITIIQTALMVRKKPAVAKGE